MKNIKDAFQYDGDLKDHEGRYYVPEWASDAFENEIIFYDSEDSSGPPIELYIVTLNGIMKVELGDYVVLDTNGEIYPCKPEIFEKMERERSERSERK